jgi:hypothetical protein
VTCILQHHVDSGTIFKSLDSIAFSSVPGPIKAVGLDLRVDRKLAGRPGRILNHLIRIIDMSSATELIFNTQSAGQNPSTYDLSIPPLP